MPIKIHVPHTAHTEIIGDGAQTVFDITHNKGSLYPTVIVAFAESPHTVVQWGELEYLDTNTLRLTFIPAPSAGEYTVTVLPVG